MIDYEIRNILAKEAKEYIIEYHYSHGCHRAPSPCYGLFEEENLIGVLMFATPCSENVRASIFGKEFVNQVMELHRLHILDITPRNTESWFISRCLDLLLVDKPQIKCVVSFSDPTAGHQGTIYQATNAKYYGCSGKATFYIDQDNRLRHPRQCGKNISKAEALQLGWKQTKRDGKYRYLWIIGNNKADRYYWLNKVKVKLLDYPKE